MKTLDPNRPLGSRDLPRGTYTHDSQGECVRTDHERTTEAPGICLNVCRNHRSVVLAAMVALALAAAFSAPAVAGDYLGPEA